MRNLPEVGRAIVDVEKLRDYCLNPNHPEGRHKARVFRAALGVGQEDADWLATQILQCLPEAVLVGFESTPYGERYDADMTLSKGAKGVVVRTGWIVRKDEVILRLVTCFVR